MSKPLVLVSPSAGLALYLRDSDPKPIQFVDGRAVLEKEEDKKAALANQDFGVKFFDEGAKPAKGEPAFIGESGRKCPLCDFQVPEGKDVALSLRSHLQAAHIGKKADADKPHQV